MPPKSSTKEPLDKSVFLPTGSVPMGTIMAYALDAKNIEGTGWLLCDGSPIPSQYQALILALGDNTPDLRGNTLIGGGTAAKSGTNYTVGQYGGEEKHVLTVEELAAHNHAYTYIEAADVGSNNRYGSAFPNLGDNSMGASTEKMGSNEGHNNMQPYYVINYIIYTGEPK
jgi:microcystin-dependent protein